MDALSWFNELAPRLENDPIAQGLLVALATFILEDAATVGAGLLVADGRMALLTGFCGLAGGITVGDIGLYWIGRFAGNRILAWNLVSEKRMHRAQHWFDRNLVATVLTARFVPGMRLPTYLGAGVSKASFLRYAILIVTASVIWTVILLTLTINIGRAILPLLGAYKWPVAIAVLVLAIVANSYFARRANKRYGAAEDDEDDAPYASFFEFWPPIVFYLPVALYYTWLALTYRSWTLPSAANPSIFAGGLIGESKASVLDLVPKRHRHLIPPYATYTMPETKPQLDTIFKTSKNILDESGLEYPIVAKPDNGHRGAGVRPVRNDHELRAYVDTFPAGATILFQKLVPDPHEVGVMYYRYPGEPHGHFPSVTWKEFPAVIGDGQHTLRELIKRHPRASLNPHLYLDRHRQHAGEVVEKGVEFRLVFSGSHCRGAIFRDGGHVLGEGLKQRIHELAISLPGFYFGRFDMRFTDLEALKRGEGFQIIEINGAGAEATHIWDPSATLLDAYRALFRQYRILFKIGHLNRAKGHPPMGPVTFLKVAREYRRLAAHYPTTM